MFLVDFSIGKRSLNPLRTQMLPYNLSSAELIEMEWAMRFSGRVWGDPWGDGQKNNTVVLEDENDKVWIRFHEGTCYAVFRGANTPIDAQQSKPSLIGRRVCGGKGCCYVERGIYKAYSSTKSLKMPSEHVINVATKAALLFFQATLR